MTDDCVIFDGTNSSVQEVEGEYVRLMDVQTDDSNTYTD